MSAARDTNLRLGIQLLLLAMEASPAIAPMLERGTTKEDLDRLAKEDDDARDQLQASIDAGAPGG